MIMVMDGYEVFGPRQLKQIDWRQDMFAEEEETERECEERCGGPGLEYGVRAVCRPSQMSAIFSFLLSLLLLFMCHGRRDRGRVESCGGAKRV